MIFGKYINRFYKKYFFHFFIGIIFLAFVNVIQLFVPEVIANITRSYDDGTLTTQYLTTNCIYIVLIAFGMLIGRFIWRTFILSGAINIQSDLRLEMFSKNEKLSQNYYKNNKVGGIMSYYTNDLDTINQSFGWGTVMLVDAFFLSILTLIKMFQVNVILTLICLIPLAVLCISAYFIDKKIEEIFLQRQNAFERMSDYTQEMFTGLRVIKAFVREIAEAKAFKKVNLNTKNKDISLVRFSAMLDTLISLLIQGMIVIAIFIGGLFIYYTFTGTWNIKFSRADLFEFNGYFNTIIWPMIALGQIIALRSRAKTSLKRITALLDADEDVKDDEVSFLPEIKGQIEFRHFSYKYSDGEEALHDISLTIEAGERVGIVGKIGSGKSTLTSVLLRLDNYNRGEIFIDGQDIMTIPLRQLRDNVAYVPQESFLFSTTIKDNICFNNTDLSDEEAIEAAEFADVHSNIVDFVEGYRTLVGERGVTLSGGQKQRIAIARAYIKKSPIMVLDDSVSAVDVKTEEKILSNLREKRKGMTTIVVASRVSTVEHLDKIIVLNNGCLESYGTHEYLMQNSPTYSNMVRLQSLENELEGGDYHG